MLAGAIALSATSGTIVGGLMLGVAYIAGMMAPLIPLALLYGRARNNVRDPKITLQLGTHAERIGIVRLAGVVLFAAFGVLFITPSLDLSPQPTSSRRVPVDCGSRRSVVTPGGYVVGSGYPRGVLGAPLPHGHRTNGV